MYDPIGQLHLQNITCSFISGVTISMYSVIFNKTVLLDHIFLPWFIAIEDIKLLHNIFFDNLLEGACLFSTKLSI